jgi:drug/metabolite transporter (DMT)-like permease
MIKASVLASLAAALVAILVGSAIVATRFVIDQTHPGSLALLRYSIGTICLIPPLLASERVSFAKRDLFPLSLLGITQFGIVVVLLNYALQFIPSARAALIFASVPLQAMVFAAFLGYERITFAKGLGVILAFVGVGVVLGERVFDGGNPHGLLGDISAFISAFAAAACSVLYRPFLKKYPTLQISSFAMAASVVFLTLVAANEGFFIAFPHFTFEGWFAVFFIGISSSVGYYLWLWALKNTTLTKVTIFLALNPVTATGLGVIFLGEKISANLLIGIIFVILGLGVLHLSRS